MPSFTRIGPAVRRSLWGWTDPGPDAAYLMRKNRWPGLELSQDGSDYFDWHHTANDTLDKIDPAQLQQNVDAWAAVLAVVANEPGAMAGAE